MYSGKQLGDLKAVLMDLLRALTLDTTRVIEYGNAAQTHGEPFTHMRIRVSMTPEGTRFDVRKVYPLRGEGGPEYFPMNHTGMDLCAGHVMDHVLVYSAPKGGSPRAVQINRDRMIEEERQFHQMSFYLTA